MEKLKFEDIFTEDDISNYNLFIEKLRNVKANGHTTKEILELICQYYQKYVKYNYDQLQVVKIRNYALHPELNEVLEKYPDDSITIENAEEIKNKYINDLNEAFLKIEGRKLTKRVIDKLFGDFGNIIHHEAKDVVWCKGKPSERIVHYEAYDKIQYMDTSSFPAIYKNGMLIEGVCSEYPFFEKKICEDLGIKHMIVKGVGTTGHGWSLIYLPEEQRWGHFDMTMVKFYQDDWIKNHEPYTEQDWITANTEDIFKMQSTREITEINGKSCHFDKNNWNELDISQFEDEKLNHEKDGRTQTKGKDYDER